MRNGLQASSDGFAVKQWTKNPGAEQASAHAGDSSIESGDQRGGTAATDFVTKNWRKEFEIADGYRINNKRVLLLVVTEAVQMTKGLMAARIVSARGVFSQIVDDRAGGGDGLAMVIETEAGQLGYAELFAKNAFCVVVLKDPVFETRFDSAIAV